MNTIMRVFYISIGILIFICSWTSVSAQCPGGKAVGDWCQGSDGSYGIYLDACACSADLDASGCDQYIEFNFGNSTSNNTLNQVYPFASTSYGQMTPPAWNEALHIVTENVRSVRGNNQWDCANDATGPGDRYLLVNGAIQPGEVFRMDNIGVISGNTYAYGFDRQEVCMNYGSPPYPCGFSHNITVQIVETSNPTNILATVDYGDPSGTNGITGANDGRCVWNTETGSFVAPSSGAISFVMIENKGEGNGTDFLVDNIYFRTDIGVCPECIENAVCSTNSGQPGTFDMNCDCICDLTNCSADCDGDGILNCNDCDPSDASNSTYLGSYCDTGDPLEVNGRIVLDGGGNCICQGTTVICNAADEPYGDACDYDGDGVPNALDLDDDNDGILDTDESACSVGFYEPFGFNIGTQRRTLAEVGLPGSSTNYNFLSDSGGNFPYAGYYTIAANTGGIYYFPNVTDPVNPISAESGVFGVNGDAVGALYRSPGFNDWILNEDYELSFWLTAPGAGGIGTNVSLNVYNASNNLIGSVNSGHRFDGNWVQHTGVITMTSNSGYFEIVSNIPEGNGNDFVIDEIRMDIANTASLNCDSDNDGIGDQFDSDSDDDGCPDAIEGGGSFATIQLQANFNILGGPSIQLGGITDVDSDGVPNLASGGQTLGDSNDDTTQPTSCFSIIASDDDWSATPYQSGDTPSTSVLGNDTADGSAATDATVTTPLNLVGDSDLNVIFDSAGNFSIPTGTGNGTYTIHYRICLEAHPSVCDRAVVTVVVDNTTGCAQQIQAAGDMLSGVPGDNITISILDNDIANGVEPATTSLVSVTSAPVSVTPGTGLLGLSFNSDGTFAIPSSATPGVYTVQYEICLITTGCPDPCSQADIELTVANPCELSGTPSVKGVDPTTCGGNDGYLEILGLNMGSLPSVNASWTGISPELATGLSQSGSALIISTRTAGEYNNLRIVDPNDPSCYVDVTGNH